MPMIQCPECKAPISDAAAACPSCGRPLRPPPVQPPKKKGMPGWAIALIIIGSLAVLGIPILGIMAAISIPAFMQARNSARRNACVSNLRQIEAAKDEYALEYGGTNGSQFTWANVSLYIKNADTKIFCPAAPVGERSLNNYEIGPLGTDPECKVDTEKHRL